MILCISPAGTQSLYLDNPSLLPAQTLSSPRNPAHSAANQWRAPSLPTGHGHLKLTMSKTELVLFKCGSIWVPLSECQHHLSTLQSQKSQPYSRFFFCLPDLTPSLSTKSSWVYLPNSYPNCLLFPVSLPAPIKLVQQSPSWSSCSPAHVHTIPKPLLQRPIQPHHSTL